MNNDINYNVQVTLEDGTTALVYAARLHNEKLDNWSGWHCAAGLNSLYIYEDKIYSGECQNDLLGNLNNKWQLLDQHTVCNRPRCSGCTADLMQEKYPIG
jgi:hypothetical protein